MVTDVYTPATYTFEPVLSAIHNFCAHICMYMPVDQETSLFEESPSVVGDEGGFFYSYCYQSDEGRKYETSCGYYCWCYHAGSMERFTISKKVRLAEKRFFLEEGKLEATIEIGKGLIASMERMAHKISSSRGTFSSTTS